MTFFGCKNNDCHLADWKLRLPSKTQIQAVRKPFWTWPKTEGILYHPKKLTCPLKRNNFKTIHFQVLNFVRAQHLDILLMDQLIGSSSHYLPGFLHPRWCRISSINSIDVSPHFIPPIIFRGEIRFVAGNVVPFLCSNVLTSIDKKMIIYWLPSTWEVLFWLFWNTQDKTGRNAAKKLRMIIPNGFWSLDFVNQKKFQKNEIMQPESCSPLAGEVGLLGWWKWRL